MRATLLLGILLVLSAATLVAPAATAGEYVCFQGFGCVIGCNVYYCIREGIIPIDAAGLTGGALGLP